MEPAQMLKETVVLLRVETNLFDLYLSGRPFHPTVEALHLHSETDAGDDLRSPPLLSWKWCPG